MFRSAYEALSDRVFRILLYKLKRRYTEGIGERMGLVSREKLQLLKRRPLWIHAVSVGEAQAASALIREMRRDGFAAPVVLSTTTETGREMAERIAHGLFDLHVYYPWDAKRYVRAALDKINPMAFIMVETEIWPNMLWELQARGIPSFLVNGRISDRTYKRGNNFVGRAFFRETFGVFERIFLRDAQDADRLVSLGVEGSKLEVAGDLKTDALLDRVSAETKRLPAAELRAEKGPVYVAGSTHTGEDETVIFAFKRLRDAVPNARLILAPRHTERADSLIEAFGRDLRVCRYSALEEEWDVAVVDKIGLLFGLYGVCEAAFVGGSFTNDGGQNILEPAAWGAPVQYGPHMEDFAEASAEFIRRGIARQAQDGVELAEIWRQVALGGIDKERVKRECGLYFKEKAGAARKSWKGIERRLTEIGALDCSMFK